jgi:hypothetical protein
VIEGFLNPFEMELSLTKLVNWLKRNGHFAKIVLKGITSDLWSSLIGELDLLCKDNWQRNRKTTQQCIEENIPFLETFRKSA